MSDSEREARHERGKCRTVDLDGLAEMIGRCPRSIQEDDRLGRLPPSVKIGNSRRWVIAEVEAWLFHHCPPRDIWMLIWAKIRREISVAAMKGPVPS